MGGKKDVLEAERVPGVPGVVGRVEVREWNDAERGLGSVAGGRYVGTTRKGRIILEVKDVIAKTSRAKVPTRVASSQAELISEGVILGFASKMGLT